MRPIIVFVSLFFLFIQHSSAQNKAVTTTFWVGGVCEMCKERIERAVDVKGIKYSSYDLNNHQLTITYNPSKISEDQIHKLLNGVGHDTEKSKATDEEYDRVHGCCHYRNHDKNH